MSNKYNGLFRFSKPQTSLENSIEEKGYRKGYKEGFEQGQFNCIEITLYMMAYTLQYKLDLDKTALQELVGYVYNNIDAYRTGHLTPEDFDTIKQDLKENYGISIK